MPIAPISSPHHPKHHDGYANSLLRGVAISAVLVLHIFANLHVDFSQPSSTWLYAVIIDQFCRFSVPLFVALSGFGFWQKYQKVDFHWKTFLVSQSRKLLPMYFLASAVFYIVFLLLPEWQDPEVTKSFFLQLLTGKADYQMYFVPMIFQLYLLFPLLRGVVKKLPWVSLFLAGIFQVWLYIVFSSTQPSAFMTKYFLTDQQQYVWSFSWIFYFILGMHLPAIINWMEVRKWSLGVISASAAAALIFAVYQGTTKISGGIDAIIALRFTNVDVLIYASLMCILLMAIAQMAKEKMRKLTRPLCKIGNHSYAIYLFHTLALRVFFTFF